MIFRLTKRDLQTEYGTFHEILYYDGQKESIALVMENIELKEIIKTANVWSKKGAVNLSNAVNA